MLSCSAQYMHAVEGTCTADVSEVGSNSAHNAVCRVHALQMCPRWAPTALIMQSAVIDDTTCWQLLTRLHCIIVAWLASSCTNRKHGVFAMHLLPSQRELGAHSLLPTLTHYASVHPTKCCLMAWTSARATNIPNAMVIWYRDCQNFRCFNPAEVCSSPAFNSIWYSQECQGLEHHGQHNTHH